MGFHQVHSTMTLGLTPLPPGAHRPVQPVPHAPQAPGRKSPRSLRYELTPGQHIKAVLEPWEQVIEMTTTFDGPKPLSVRTWGRDRLADAGPLAAALPKRDVYLADMALPSVYVLDLGLVVFTLALSAGRITTGRAARPKFDLLSRPPDGEPGRVTRTYEALREVRRASDAGLAASTRMEVEKSAKCVTYLCQVGRAMYDLGSQVYRHRDLFQGAFSAQDAAAAVRAADKPTTPQERAGPEDHGRGQRPHHQASAGDDWIQVSGSARGTIDPERVRRSCTSTRRGASSGRPAPV